MARRRRSPAQMSLVGGIESWYMPVAGARGKLRKVLQYAEFVDHPADVAARRLIEVEVREVLEELQGFVQEWERFWDFIYHSDYMTSDQVMAELRKLAQGLEEIA